MSDEIFPTFPGTTLQVQRPVEYATDVQESASGYEYRALWFNRPRTRFGLNIEVLRSQYPNDWQAFVSFYQRHGGRFDSFNFTDPDDYTIPADSPMVFGVGDGSDTTFQLQRTLSTGLRFRGSTLFNYKPGDNVTLKGGTFSRASTATYADRYGIMRTAATGVLRDAHYIDGVRTTLIEVASTNRCLYSQDFTNAAWSKSNTTLTSNAVTAPDGTITADLIVNSSASPISVVGQSLSVVGNGTKTLSVFIREYNNDKLSLEWSDTTAGAQRQFVVFEFNGSNAPTVDFIATSPADVVAIVPWIQGFWRVSVRVPSVVAANVNQLYIGAGFDGTINQGSYMWGVQVEDLPIPTSYIPTTSVAVARGTDDLRFPFAAKPQAMTVYADLIDLGTALDTVSTYWYWNIGNTDPYFVGLNAAASGGGGLSFTTYIQNTSGFTGGGNSPVTAYGTRVRARGVLQSNAATYSAASLNGGAEVVGAVSSIPSGGMPAAWSTSILYMGGGQMRAAAMVGFSVLLGEQSAADCADAASESGNGIALYPDFRDGYEPVKSLADLPVIYSDGTALVPGIDWTVDDDGVVTFTTAPASGARLSWSGSYYKRVRFDTDAQASSRIVMGLWDATSVPLIEVLG